VSLVAKGLQRRGRRNGDGRGLLEGEVDRLQRQLVLTYGRVLGESALADPDDLVAWAEPRHIRADGLDSTGDLATSYRVLRPAQAKDGSDQIGQARHEVPDTEVHTGRVYAKEHLVVRDLRTRDLPKLEHVG
jgi:hypothetical protein